MYGGRMGCRNVWYFNLHVRSRPQRKWKVFFCFVSNFRVSFLLPFLVQLSMKSSSPRENIKMWSENFQ